MEPENRPYSRLQHALTTIGQTVIYRQDEKILITLSAISLSNLAGKRHRKEFAYCINFSTINGELEKVGQDGNQDGRELPENGTITIRGYLEMLSISEFNELSPITNGAHTNRTACAFEMNHSMKNTDRESV